MCEVFGFGSNGSGQLGLGSGSVDRCPKPIKLENMSNCSYVSVNKEMLFVCLFICLLLLFIGLCWTELYSGCLSRWVL